MKYIKIFIALLLLMMSVLVISSCGKIDGDPNSIPEEPPPPASPPESLEANPANGGGYLIDIEHINEFKKTVSEQAEQIKTKIDSLASAPEEGKEPVDAPTGDYRWLALLIAGFALVGLLFMLYKAVSDLRNIINSRFDRLNERIKEFKKTEGIQAPAFPKGVQPASTEPDSMVVAALKDFRDNLERLTLTPNEQITKEYFDNVMEAIYNNLNQKMTDIIKNNLEESQNQTLDFVSKLEQELAKLKQDTRDVQALNERILARVDALNDDRFLRLRLHFRDVSDDLQKAFLAYEKSDPTFQSNLGEYVENFSKLVNLQQLSSAPAELNKAYYALKDVFKNNEVVWVFPKTGDKFDPDTMEQHKRVGDLENVYAVLIPGFEIGEIKRKALVDVG